MDSQTLYRIGSPALGGPPLLELRYRVVGLERRVEAGAIPALLLHDLTTVETWVRVPGGWVWWRVVGRRLARAVARALAVLAQRPLRRGN